MWMKWRCRRCYSNIPAGLQGKYRQAVAAKSGAWSTGSSTSSGEEERKIGTWKLRVPQFFIILQGIAGATDVFQLLTRVLDGFLVLLILGVDEIDSSQFSCVFEMNLFDRPLLLFLQLGVLSH